MKFFKFENKKNNEDEPKEMSPKEIRESYLMYTGRDPSTRARERLTPDEEVKMDTAGNQSTTREELAELSTDPSRFVKMCVAANPNTPPDVLEELMELKDWRINQYIAANPKAPLSLLAGLIGWTSVDDVGRIAIENFRNQLQLEASLTDDDVRSIIRRFDV